MSWQTSLSLCVVVGAVLASRAVVGKPFETYQYSAAGAGGLQQQQQPVPAGVAPGHFDFPKRQQFAGPPPGYILDDHTQRDDQMSFLQRLVRPWTWFSWLTERSDDASASGGQFENYDADRFAGELVAAPPRLRPPHVARVEHPSRLAARPGAGASAAGGWAPHHHHHAAAFKTARSDPGLDTLHVQQQSVHTSVGGDEQSASSLDGVDVRASAV